MLCSALSLGVVLFYISSTCTAISMTCSVRTRWVGIWDSGISYPMFSAYYKRRRFLISSYLLRYNLSICALCVRVEEAIKLAISSQRATSSRYSCTAWVYFSPFITVVSLLLLICDSMSNFCKSCIITFDCCCTLMLSSTSLICLIIYLS